MRKSRTAREHNSQGTLATKIRTSAAALACSSNSSFSCVMGSLFCRRGEYRDAAGRTHGREERAHTHATRSRQRLIAAGAGRWASGGSAQKVTPLRGLVRWLLQAARRSPVPILRFSADSGWPAQRRRLQEARYEVAPTAALFCRRSQRRLPTAPASRVVLASAAQDRFTPSPPQAPHRGRWPGILLWADRLPD